MRRYDVLFNAVAVTLAQDLFEVINANDQSLLLEEVVVTQDTEAGDAASEQQRFTIKRAAGTYTSGSGGATATPQKRSFGDPASGVTVEINNTTRAVAGTGTLDILNVECENVHNGLHYKADPGKEIEFSPSQAIVIGLEGAPADSITMSGRLTFVEVGG
jgi:hypothetical protein